MSIDAISDFEKSIYDEIMDQYQEKIGGNSYNETFVYQEMIKLMRTLKEEIGNDREKLKSVITNALIMLLELFFLKDNDDDGDEKSFSSDEKKYLSGLFEQAINFAQTAA